MTPISVFDFSTNSDLSYWRVVDDGVMGGRSAGRLSLNTDGNAVFKGYISLDNNGGFSSVRYRENRISLDTQSKFVLRVKGDGKKYQFRVKAQARQYFSHIYYFHTTGDWETIEIPFEQMYPTFRGRRLNGPNYQGEQIEEIAFLFGNKKEESFKLEIDKIEIH